MRSGLLVVAVLVSLLVVAPARAGTYDVYSCRLPDGSPAPTNGWVPFASAPPELGVSMTANSCGSAGGLRASLSSFVPAGVEVGWKFTSPPATTIDGFELFRTATPVNPLEGVVAGYVSSLGAWPPFDLGQVADERCLTAFAGEVAPCVNGLGVPGLAFDESNRYARRGIHASTLTLGVGCWDLYAAANPLCYVTGGPAAVLTVAAAKLTLRDDKAPTVSADLPEGSTVRAEVGVSISAADEGAGLAEKSLVVDGTEGPRSPIDDLPPSCRRPFVDTVPCPLHRNASIPFDSHGYADGVHVLQAAVIDAAGNRSLSAPVSVVVANTAGVSSRIPGPNGRAATRFARLRAWFAGRSRKAYRTLAYGAATSVEGQLTTSDGLPIGGATLQVEQRDIGVASKAKEIATVTTDAKGRYTYRVARGASRSFRFSYTAFPGDVGPVALAQVAVHVRAGVSLRASPARVRNGTVLTFKGRVLGERGTRRAVVTIYALSNGPRPRIPVETFRAAASGRFTYRYRFRSIPGPVAYRFEARVLKQTGFPYVEGASRPVTVRGRP
jgi:hypothetical protein